MENHLRFAFMRDNSKLAQLVPLLIAEGYTGQHLILNLPSGPLNTCGFAKDCAASPVPLDADGNVLPRHQWREAVRWKIVNGDEQQFRCYAASLEVGRTALNAILHTNLDLLKAAFRAGRQSGIEQLLVDSLAYAGAWNNGSAVRVHSHGEFWNKAYFNAWLWAAEQSPRNLYYAYTKAVGWYLDAHIEGRVPANFRFTMSRGGTQDGLIDLHYLKESIVVASEQEAYDLGLKVDHDDSHAALGDRSFALMVHGAGTANYKRAYSERRELVLLEVAAD